MKIWDYQQGSEEWLRARIGRPTASRFKDIITPTGAISKSAIDYALELIADSFVTDLPPEFEGNKWTDRGHEIEPLAREWFKTHTGFDVREVGFVTQDNEMVGCSPDSLIYAGGKPVAGLEIKGHAPKKHVKIVHEGILPPEHAAQIHGSMHVCGLETWHFVSYCPGMNPFHFIAERNEYTTKVGAAVDQFMIDYVALRTKLIPLLQIQTPST
jgi:hypothetical protein